MKKEAIWCISNLTQGGNRSQVDELIKNDLLERLVESITDKNSGSDKQLVHVALEGINNILMVRFS